MLVVAYLNLTTTDLDLIIVLKDGGLAEQGTHEELLAKQGLYYDMWIAQQETGSPLTETETVTDAPPSKKEPVSPK